MGPKENKTTVKSIDDEEISILFKERLTKVSFLLGGWSEVTSKAGLKNEVESKDLLIIVIRILPREQMFDIMWLRDRYELSTIRK